ncbi:hypothetical protein OAY16_00560 [Candidatus Pelagibacter sp.]|nr:hypothetical protein [Candidatus Pelagibacter sp.]
MNYIIKFLFIFSFFFIPVNANIVDELTKLNNLFKEGAINQEEFIKAKNILLKSNTEKNLTTIKKNTKDEKNIVAEVKEIKDISDTYINKDELKIIGKYVKINNYPENLFENLDFSPSMLSKLAAQEMYKTFVQHKNLNEKNPENMMKAMAYFEVFYNNKLKEEKKAIEDYEQNYPNVKKTSKKTIQSLFSLTQAKKSMRNSIGLSIDDNIGDALEKYMHMYNFLGQGEKAKHKLTREEKKLRAESKKFKKYYGSFKKNIELKSELRIDQKTFKKNNKKNIKNLNKTLKKLNKINPEKYQIYKTVENIFNNSLEILNKCAEDCDQQKLTTIIDSVDFTNAILKDAEKKIVKKLYTNDLSKIKIENFSEKQKETLMAASLSTKRQNKLNQVKLQKSILNLANNNYQIDKIITKLENQGYELTSIKMSFADVNKMQSWKIKDWANSWRGDLPKNEFKDKDGNLIQLTDQNIEDLKAQLARNEFENILTAENLNIAEKINDNLNEIAKAIQDNPGFNLDRWLNQDFSITLDNYTKIAAESIISELGGGIDQETINAIRKNANFDNLTRLVNMEYGTNMTSEEYASYWQNAAVDGSTSNWGDITAGVDLLSQVGSFEAASIAKDLGTDLQTVADSISLAASVGVSTDLEAASQGLGFDSFADAVEAYNKQYGTNYSVDEAKEALGQ